jgi:hypothetical protein
MPAATKTVAEQWPARTDTRGVTWYRPALTAGVTLQTWGWTAQPEQADPSYGLGQLAIIDGQLSRIFR